MKYNFLLLLTTTFIIYAQQREDRYEWSLLFTEFLLIPKQDLSPTPIFDTNAKATQQNKIVSAQQEADQAESEYTRLQNKAEKAKLAAQKSRQKADALLQAHL